MYINRLAHALVIGTIICDFCDDLAKAGAPSTLLYGLGVCVFAAVIVVAIRTLGALARESKSKRPPRRP